MSDTTLTEEQKAEIRQEWDEIQSESALKVFAIARVPTLLSALEAAEKRAEEAEKESRLANELVDSYAASFKKLAVTIGYERGGLGAQALAENLVSERDTLRAEVERLTSFIETVKLDLEAQKDSAEAALLLMDAYEQDHPKRAETSMQLAFIEHRIGEADAALTKKEPSDGQE